MISLPHKTIFVHIPKCAGQSVEAAFCADLGMDWGRHRHLLGCFQRPPTWAKDLPMALAHLTAAEYTAREFCPGALFETCFRFAVIRDPVERVVSAWRYLKTDRSFADFVAHALPALIAEDHYFHRTQRAFLYAPGSDRLLVDLVIPFSALGDGWDEVQRRSGVRAALPHRNRSETRKARPDISPQHRAIIERLYAEDYETFARF